MSIASLLSVFKVFRNEELSAEERDKLMHEVLLLTLARASNSDSNVSTIEVSAVRNAIREEIGVEVSEADVRVAAKSELFETASLDSTLRKLSDRLSPEDRMLVVRRLGDVIKTDSRASEFERDFYDRVVRALRIPPSMLAEISPQK